MGTNYYLHQKPDCPCCGRPYKPLHIGKSSGGWCFSLHVIPEDGINTLDDWRKLWSEADAFIRDEYGSTVNDMENIITDRQWQQMPECHPCGYDSWSDFHRRNHSEPGPNGLVRHAVDGHCIGHGEGTWDYIVGEFS